LFSNREFKRVTSDAQTELRQALADPIKDIQGTANEYRNMFTDAAKSVNKELSDTVKEPTFIPHPGDTSSTSQSNVAQPDTAPLLEESATETHITEAPAETPESIATEPQLRSDS
jgi:hypothetical protein